jgi:hypothetical protein
MPDLDSACISGFTVVSARVARILAAQANFLDAGAFPFRG